MWTRFVWLGCCLKSHPLDMRSCGTRSAFLWCIPFCQGLFSHCPLTHLVLKSPGPSLSIIAYFRRSKTGRLGPWGGPCWCSQKLLCILCCVAHTFGGQRYFLAGNNNLQGHMMWVTEFLSSAWLGMSGIWLVTSMLCLINSCGVDSELAVIGIYLHSTVSHIQSSVTLWFSFCKLSSLVTSSWC